MNWFLILWILYLCLPGQLHSMTGSWGCAEGGGVSWDVEGGFEGSSRQEPGHEGRRKSHLGTKESKGQLCITERNQPGQVGFLRLFLCFQQQREAGLLDFFKARLQSEWAAKLRWDHGPMTGVGMSQTGFVHQGRFLQSCTKSHKVPFSDLFLPMSLLQSHHLFNCSIPWSQSCLSRGHAATQTLFGGQIFHSENYATWTKDFLCFHLLQLLRLYHQN